MLRSLLACLVLLIATPAGAITLRAAFEAAGPGEGYDKLVVLEAGVVYTGGLHVGPILVPESTSYSGEAGLNVKIVGGGAVLDLGGSQLAISYCPNRLDVEDCVIVNGSLRYRGLDYEPDRQPRGTVRQVTFYRPHDYALRLQRTGSGIVFERNLLVDAVETGPDWIFNNGYPMDWLQTGLNVALGLGGAPLVRDNWSFRSNAHENADPLLHFGFL
ncbi:hypothetical protein FJ251_07975 [bacterium]|nr:hypothetical protein [bacterium]